MTGDRNGAGLDIIDLATKSISKTLTNLGNIQGIEVSPHGDQIYIISKDREVIFIDTATWQPTHTVEMKGSMWELATDCSGQNLYVSHSSNQNLTTIDTSTAKKLSDFGLNSPYSGGVVACPQQTYPNSIYFLAPNTAVESEAGSTVEHQVDIINAIGQQNHFNLRIEDNAWSSTLVSDTIGPIEAYAKDTITISVSIPITVSKYASDSITLVATSLTSPLTYTNSITFQTQALGASNLLVSPPQANYTVTANTDITIPITMTNRSSQPLEVSFEGVIPTKSTFAAASTELYAYMPFSRSELEITGLDDLTNVQVTNLATGEIAVDIPVLNQAEIYSAYPAPQQAYKITSNKPIIGQINRQNDQYTTFVPSLEGDPVGKRFILNLDSYTPPQVYIFASEETMVTRYDENWSLIETVSLAANDYLKIDITDTTKRAEYILSTGNVAVQMGETGGTYVPSTEGSGAGTEFLCYVFGTVRVHAYEDVTFHIYNLTTGSVIRTQSLKRGTMANIGGLTTPIRLESDGKVSVWAGSSDDISVTDGADGQEFFLSKVTAVGGTIDSHTIFAPLGNTIVEIDGEHHHLQKDGFLRLGENADLYHIRSTKPIIISNNHNRNGERLGLGTFLGGIDLFNGDTAPWVTTSQFSMTIPAVDTITTSIVLDARNQQPGIYYANLLIKENSSFAPISYIPITLTVEPLATMGRITGTVRNATSDESIVATVTANGNQATTESEFVTGLYDLWLESGPQTLAFSADGFDTQTVTVDIVAQQTITQDVDLVVSVPKVGLSNNIAVQTAIEPNGQLTLPLNIINGGSASLIYELSEWGQGPPSESTNLARFTGGPDMFGYTFSDSTEMDGPVYDWVEISTTGTEITNWNDSSFTPIASQIPIGFDFNFYGNVYNDLTVAADGYVQFGPIPGIIPSSPGTTIPSPRNPNNTILIFGKNYELRDGVTGESAVYYQTLSNPPRFVLQMTNLYGCCSSQRPGDTMQLILYPNGNILMQYQTPLSRGPDVVGIENEFATDGLAYDYNSTIWDETAICFAFPGNSVDCIEDVQWLSLNQTSGTIDPFSQFDVGFQIDSSGLPPGTYEAGLRLTSNDPITPVVDIPITMHVADRQLQQGNIAYVTLGTTDTLVIIDMESETELARHQFSQSLCDYPWRPEMTPDGSRVYVTCYESDSIAVIDTGTYSVTNYITTIPDADGVTFTNDGNQAFVGSRRSDDIYVVDTQTEMVSSVIPNIGYVRSLVTNPTNNEIYATDADDELLIIDTDTLTITGSIPTSGSEPFDIDVTPDGRWLVSGDRFGTGLDIVDTSTLTIAERITGLGNLVGLEVSPFGDKIYAASLNTNIYFIDVDTWEVSAVDLPDIPWELATDCSGQFLYVTNARSRLLTILNARTGEKISDYDVLNSGGRGIVACPQKSQLGSVYLWQLNLNNQVSAGQIVTHTLRLVNHTNQTDTFDLTIDSGTWDYALSRTTLGPISGGESMTFTVAVTVPITATQHETETVTVSATSVTGPALYRASVQLTTESAGSPSIDASANSLGITGLSKGDQFTQTLTITNTGTAPLTVELSAMLAERYSHHWRFQIQHAPRPATDIPWLSLSPTTATLAPQESIDIDVIIDSATLDPGDYNAIIRLSSNDILNPVQDIPVALNVTEPQVEETIVFIPLVSRP